MLIGGTYTCPGTTELQAKESLLEDGHLGPQRGGRTQVRGRWVWSWGWAGQAGPEVGKRGAGSRHLVLSLAPLLWAWASPASVA